MSKIAKEMYASTLRNLVWQMAEDLGALGTTQLLTATLAEYTGELSQLAHEQGVVLQQPTQDKPEITDAA